MKNKPLNNAVARFIGLVALCQLLASGCAPTLPTPLTPLESDAVSKSLAGRSDFNTVCIGEAHTSAFHHHNQLKLIQGLHDGGADLAIGLEMFPYTSQPLLDGWIAGDISVQDFRKNYALNWQIPFALYEDIFFYAREKKIPLLGLNVPQSIARKVGRQGFAALSAPEKQTLPANIYCNPNTPQMFLLRNVLASYDGGRERFQRFCEAHMLRDKTMAMYAADYLTENPGKTVLVLAGIGHCVKQGTPLQLETITGKKSIAVLPVAAEEVLKLSMTDDYADYLLEE